MTFHPSLQGSQLLSRYGMFNGYPSPAALQQYSGYAPFMAAPTAHQQAAAAANLPPSVQMQMYGHHHHPAHHSQHQQVSAAANPAAAAAAMYNPYSPYAFPPQFNMNMNHMNRR